MSKTETLIFAFTLMMVIFGGVIFFIGAVELHTNQKNNDKHKPKTIKKVFFKLIDSQTFPGLAAFFDKMLFKERYYKKEYLLMAIGGTMFMIPCTTIAILDLLGYIN